MRRLITTLAILLVVIVAGMTALVLLVNPNDFRTYMVNQVEQRSGYKLTLQGALRWHVWPQLSILAGRMSLTAPGAEQPMVSAENMRLDVHLWPLLSHQLSVKQVLLKGAVIRLTPESMERRPIDAPVAPDNTPDVTPIEQGWKFDIASLEVADGLLVWQQPGGEQINFRDIALSLSQDAHKQAHIELNSRVNRDQRELQLNLNADMNVAAFPRELSASIGRLDYTLKGVDLPSQGITGQASVDALWRDNQTFVLSNLVLSANDTALTGEISGSLANAKTLDVALHASRLNLDSLLGITRNDDPASVTAGGNILSGKRPVISESAGSNHEQALLTPFIARLNLGADAMLWRGISFNNVKLTAENQHGDIAINQFSGESGKGHFSLPGKLDLRQADMKLELQPELTNIAMAPLLKAFEMPDSISGNLTLKGNVSGSGLSIDAVKQNWKGKADLSMTDARLAGLNFTQLISRAVANSSDRVSGNESDADYTELKHIQARALLNRGALTLDKLKGKAALLDLTGKGDVDIAKRQCDFTFAITVTGGWRGESKLTDMLSKTPIPLRVYGNWDALNYNLSVDQILRQRLEDEAKKRMQSWAEKNQHKQSGKDVKQFLDHL